MSTLFSPLLVHQFLQRSARCYPEKTAIVFGDKRLSYRELDRATDVLAAFLQKNGLQSQDRVVVFSDNRAEVVTALFGILKAGAAFVILNGSIKAPKLAYILKDSGASWIIAEESKRAIVREAMSGADICCSSLWIEGDEALLLKSDSPQFLWSDAVQQDPSDDYFSPLSPRRLLDIDLAALIYTSGSTGEPKGVVSTHANMISAARSIIDYLENTDQDVVLNCLPLSFDYGLYQSLMTVMFGGTIVLVKSFVFLDEILRQISAEQVTGFPVVPTIAAMILKLRNPEKYDFSSIRYITNTGAALPQEHIAKLRRLLPHVSIYSMFGLTECKRVCYLPPNEIDRRPGSVGVAMPNCEIAIVDEMGGQVSLGEVGELVIRGANVMQGYWNAPELTAAVYRQGRYPAERWLYSGDLFRQDCDGFLYFVGRKGEMIKSRGERISPKEIEDALCQFDGVAEAAVIGVADELLGQAVKAYVAPLPGHTLNAPDILHYCKQRLEGFMVPKYLTIVENLPKSPNGKIDKTSLKDS